MDVAWRQRVREVRFGFDGIWIYKYGELHDGVQPRLPLCFVYI